MLPCVSSLSSVAAQELGSSLQIPNNIRGRVNFWILVFTRYGKNQLIFHHREQPEIVYSVLDFEELSQRSSGSEFERKKAEHTREETERIQSALSGLASGGAARTPFERRLERLFLQRGRSDLSRRYREAMLGDNIRTQTGIKEKFRDGLSRSRRYMHAMERIFRESGLPPELARLPHVESSFDYTAYSSVGAAGIWQFMRSTGRYYMRIDNNVDERRDPIVSTRAAAHYLKHAFSQTNSWPLAVTSYNHGITGVLRAAKSVGTTDIGAIIDRYDGSSFGFASKNFYSEFLAAVEADRNWRNYFPELKLEAPVLFDEVRLGSAVRFADLVRLSSMSEEDFAALNPGLLKPVTSGRAPVPAGKTVKVPQGKGRYFAQLLPGATILNLTELPTPKRPTETARRKSVPKKAAVVKKGAPRKSVVRKPVPHAKGSGSTTRFKIKR